MKTNPTKKIITIGGGDVSVCATLAIDRQIVDSAEAENPRLLFIPTASSDDADYWRFIDVLYRKRLGCRTDVLFLVKEKPSREKIEKKILNADIIYVGGGNTLMMMKLWRRLGVDKLLYKVWQKGTVLCGLSAGSICWYDSGHSDSMASYHPEDWDYINVRCLGFIKAVHCPHYDSATLDIPRRESFHAMMRKIGGLGIAIDDNCAIQYFNDTYRVINSKKTANAYRVFKQNGGICSEQVPQSKEWRPLKELLTK